MELFFQLDFYLHILNNPLMPFSADRFPFLVLYTLKISLGEDSMDWVTWNVNTFVSLAHDIHISCSNRVVILNESGKIPLNES